MDTKFLTDVVFFLVTSLSIEAGGRLAVRKIHYMIERESLTTVQQGLPKLENFTRALTKPPRRGP